MHIVETYALDCGAKINKPSVYEKYVPLPFDKYISFHVKYYQYFPEVISLIENKLLENGISILQVKTVQGQEESKNTIPNSASFSENAYIIRNSLLHFGEDDYLFDICGVYDTPRLIIFSNTFPNTTKPYWGSESKQEIIQELGDFKKPSLSPDPNTNFVNKIYPEKIASKIMSLLGIEWKAPYKTLYIGNSYRAKHDMIEIYPENVGNININGFTSSIAARMDYRFDEPFLAGLLSKTKASIITNKGINFKILEAMKANIVQIAYMTDDDIDIKFAKDLGKLNLEYAVIFTGEEDKYKKQKEKIFDVQQLHHRPIFDVSKHKIFENGFDGLEFKSAKRLMRGGEEYKCFYSFSKNDKSNCNVFSKCPKDLNQDFIKEMDFFFITKPS